jgi:hypothetical protein
MAPGNDEKLTLTTSGLNAQNTAHVAKSMAETVLLPRQLMN